MTEVHEEVRGGLKEGEKLCKQCLTPILKEAKRCPYCGGKPDGHDYGYHLLMTIAIIIGILATFSLLSNGLAATGLAAVGIFWLLTAREV